MSQILNKYCKEFNLTEILINNIDSYLKLVLQINENNKSKGINLENYANYVNNIKIFIKYYFSLDFFWKIFSFRTNRN